MRDKTKSNTTKWKPYLFGYPGYDSLNPFYGAPDAIRCLYEASLRGELSNLRGLCSTDHNALFSELSPFYSCRYVTLRKAISLIVFSTIRNHGYADKLVHQLNTTHKKVADIDSETNKAILNIIKTENKYQNRVSEDILSSVINLHPENLHDNDRALSSVDTEYLLDNSSNPQEYEAALEKDLDPSNESYMDRRRVWVYGKSSGDGEHRGTGERAGELVDINGSFWLKEFSKFVYKLSLNKNLRRYVTPMCIHHLSPRPPFVTTSMDKRLLVPAELSKDKVDSLIDVLRDASFKRDLSRKPSYLDQPFSITRYPQEDVKDLAAELAGDEKIECCFNTETSQVCLEDDHQTARKPHTSFKQEEAYKIIRKYKILDYSKERARAELRIRIRQLPKNEQPDPSRIHRWVSDVYDEETLIRQK